MKLVIVEWEDSHFALHGWTLRDNPEPVTRFVSLGVLIREDNREIEIVPNHGREYKSQGITIPRGCIKRIRYLKIEEAP